MLSLAAAKNELLQTHSRVDKGGFEWKKAGKTIVGYLLKEFLKKSKIIEIYVPKDSNSNFRILLKKVLTTFQFCIRISHLREMLIWIDNQKLLWFYKQQRQS